MEIVLLMLMGLGWVLFQIVEIIDVVIKSKMTEAYNLVAKDIIATEEETQDAERILANSQSRNDGIMEIKDVLDDIFGDRWHQWAERNDFIVNPYSGYRTQCPYSNFNSLCLSLLLAKRGKMRKSMELVKNHSVCGLSKEESSGIIKRISFAVEKMLVENHPDHAYDLEMVTRTEHYGAGCSPMPFISPRFFTYAGKDKASWKRLEL